MKKTTILFILCYLSMKLIAQSSQATLQGKITEAQTGEDTVGVYIKLYKIDILKGTTSTDFEGNYSIYIEPGTYDVEISYVGMSTKKINSVVLNGGRITKLDVKLELSGTVLGEAIVTSHKIPLVQQDNTTSGSTVTNEQIKNMPTRNVTAILGLTSGKQAKKIKKEEPVAHHESYQHLSENTFLPTDKNPLSTFSIDVDRAAYANVRRFIQQGTQPPADAVRIEEMINYFDYQYDMPKDEHPIAIHTELSESPWNKGLQLCRIALQAKNMDKIQLPPSNLVFLLDVSGSMQSDNKLPLVKKAFELLINKLRENDKIAIVVYAGAAGVVLSSTNDKTAMRVALQKLEADGSTAGGEGIALAYKIAEENFMPNGNNRVILATDGDFNVGVSSEEDLEKLIISKQKTGIYLSVLGFGMGNYKDDKLELLADKGNGNYAYIDNLKEAKKMFVKEFSATIHTLAKDVKLQIEFNPKYVNAYRLVGYENRLLADEDFNNDKKDAGEIGVGHTVTAIYEIIPTGVQSDYLCAVDHLKYQKSRKTKRGKLQNEFATVKMRYKKPTEHKSILLEKTIDNQLISFQNTSDNFKLAASVAEFGLLLKNSKFKGNANFEHLIQTVSQTLQNDTEQLRNDFLILVQQANQIMQ